MLDAVEQLVDLVARSGVREVTVRWDGKRVTVRKGRHVAAAVPALAAPVALADVAPASGTFPAALEPEAGTLSEAHWITAPMVGLFRHSEPPVGPGVRVEQGQVVGAIESMKLLNDVRADVSGVIRVSAVEGGMAVEYGQPLFAVAGEEP